MSDLAVNRQALHDFEVLDTYEGGLVLTGAEVKSARAGHVNLKGSFLTMQNGELILKNAHIGHYAPAGSAEGYDPTHDKKVLVHKKELNILRGRHEAERLTMVPISLYTSKSRVKLKFVLARGKKKHEKRAVIKARDLDRDTRRYGEYDT
ncbi:MAG: SsrA-binding protein SmpB [Patescibacteria group bacterium]|jgi:SsrA-binding protein